MLRINKNLPSSYNGSSNYKSFGKIYYNWNKIAVRKGINTLAKIAKPVVQKAVTKAKSVAKK